MITALRQNRPQLLPTLLVGGFLLAAALLGVVAASGNIILIALVVGGLFGVLLLNALPLTVWSLLVGAMLINGPVGYFFPEFDKVSWLFSLIGVFMSGAAALYLAVGRERPARPAPGFVILAVAFLGYALAGALFSQGSVPEIVAGAKRFFHFWGLIFLMAVVPFKVRTVKAWVTFLLLAAVLQLPMALYQRIVLVPQVMGFDMPGFVPFDIIVGTFGGSIYGGGESGILAVYLVLVAIGLLCAYVEKLIGLWFFLISLAIVVAPLGLGETKVVLVLLPLVLVAAFHDQFIKRPAFFLGGALVVGVLFVGLFYLYFMVQVTDQYDMNLDDQIAATLAYNFGTQGYYGTGVNRLTAVPYWFEQQSFADPLGAMFGHGLGASYGGDGRVPLPGHMFVAYPGMFIDLVAMSLVLWDHGIVGGLMFLGVLLLATISSIRCLNEASSPFDRTLCRTLVAAMAINWVMLVYSSSIITSVSHGFLFSLFLALLAWRSRHGPIVESGPARSSTSPAAVRQPTIFPPSAYPGAPMEGRIEPRIRADADPADPMPSLGKAGR